MAKSSLSEWASVAEIGAAAGVIITLIFVGLELQSNTKATEAAMRQAINQNDIAFLSLQIDSSVLAVANAKRLQGEELSFLEETQLIREQYVNFASFQHTFFQYGGGVISADEWLRHENILRRQIQGSPYSLQMWQNSHEAFTPEFQDLVDSFISD